MATYLAAVRAKRRPGSDIGQRQAPSPATFTHRPNRLRIQLRTLVQLQFCRTETRASAGRLSSTKLGRWSERYRGRTAGFTPQRTAKTEPEGKPASASTVMISGAAPLAPAGSLQNDFGIPR